MKNQFINQLCFLLIILFGSVSIHADNARLRFTNAALSDILFELSKFYSVNFIYHDELIEGKNATCNLSSQNSDLAVQELLNTFNLSFEKITENTYVLYYKIKYNTITKKTIKTVIEGKNPPVLIPPKAISNIPISYPDIAKQKGFEGSIVMNILIDKKGNVKTVRIQTSSKSDILDKAAVEYIKKIKFLPARIDNQSVNVWSKWKVIFDLVPSDTSYSEIIFENIEQ